VIYPLKAWNPKKELALFQSRLARLFEGGGVSLFSSAQRTSARSIWAPSVDIAENPESFKLRAELPDVEKERIKIEAQDGVLILRGERRFSFHERDEAESVERQYGSFYRSFRLPNGADENSIRASFENGVLEVWIPKTDRSQRNEVKKIRIA
jgi:HSP20 family protein